ncbi:UpxY family transcription antiterminator [Mucilaginibacter sp. CAU 1740]|uniref:UpxY family transcription antiterminator n=1 Tax=Mucilaginibacter sp. CAU 1740 TaxID=3140365 RepID=UPI00325AF960
MDQIEKKWIVIYTRPRWEKKIDQSLKDNCFKSYCPLLQITKKWSDRVKCVEMPLFPSYIFVLANIYDIPKIMQVAGVLHIVKHCANPVTISNQEIENIKSIIHTYADVEAVSLQNYTIGEQIKINDGMFSNQKGTVKAYHGRLVVMTIENLGFALTVKIKPEYLSRPPGTQQNRQVFQQI